MAIRFQNISPIVVAILLAMIGFVFFQPQTLQQITSLTVSLALIGFLPWVIDTGFRKSINGIILGAVLGLPVATSFNFWPIELIFVAIGWVSGAFAERRPGTSPGSVNFNLSFMFALVFLFATIFFVVQMQSKILSTSNAVFVDRNSPTMAPANANIVIEIAPNGDYVLGEKITSTRRDAIVFLNQNIEMLLNAGIAPEKISIIGVTPHDIRHQNKIWVLREAFGNVRGKELTIRFVAEHPAND